MKLRPSPAIFAGAFCCAAFLNASPLLLYPDAEDDRVRCIDTALAQVYTAPAVASIVPAGDSLSPGYWSVDPYAESSAEDERDAPVNALSFLAGNSGEANPAWTLKLFSEDDLEGAARDRLDLHIVYASDVPPAGMAFGFTLICVLAREPLHRRKRRWEPVPPEPR